MADAHKKWSVATDAADDANESRKSAEKLVKKAEKKLKQLQEAIEHLKTAQAIPNPPALVGTPAPVGAE